MLLQIHRFQLIFGGQYEALALTSVEVKKMVLKVVFYVCIRQDVRRIGDDRTDLA